MTKKILLLLLAIVPSMLYAQVTISAQLPPGGMVQKDQLWNLVLVNNKEDILDISIKMNLQDASTGQILLSANTGNFLLGKGVKVITSRDAEPIMYNSNTQEFSRGYLPMGAYIVCYQLYRRVGELQDILGDECIRINIDPLSPPLLNTPADKAIIETPYPQFTWMPPTPVDMFSNLTYDILITEVLPGQSASEAIQYNTPVYNRGNILNTNEDYPTSFSKLDTGKLYAWQVIAKNEISYAAKTEIWTFSLKIDVTKQRQVNNNYILLDDKVAGTYIIEKDMLHIKYYSYDAEYVTSIIFSNAKGDVIKRVKQKIVPGDNYLDFNVSNGFRTKTLYKVSITDKNYKDHILSFSINNN